MSDLLIRGMDMPIDGFITVTITSDGRVVGNSKRERDKFEYLKNEDIAIAVPVPPHGRSIDAEALKVSLVFAEKTAKWAAPALRAVLMVIDEMPTIIPPEEET